MVMPEPLPPIAGNHKLTPAPPAGRGAGLGSASLSSASLGSAGLGSLGDHDARIDQPPMEGQDVLVAGAAPVAPVAAHHQAQPLGVRIGEREGGEDREDAA